MTSDSSFENEMEGKKIWQESIQHVLVIIDGSVNFATVTKTFSCVCLLIVVEFLLNRAQMSVCQVKKRGEKIGDGF